MPRCPWACEARLEKRAVHAAGHAGTAPCSQSSRRAPFAADDGVGPGPLLTFACCLLFPAQTMSGVASKEWSLEKTLSKMAADWKGVEFRCIEYKDT